MKKHLIVCAPIGGNVCRFRVIWRSAFDIKLPSDQNWIIKKIVDNLEVS